MVAYNRNQIKHSKAKLKVGVEPMRFFQRNDLIASTVLASLLSLTTAKSHGAFFATLQQSGSNVVASGSGTINTSGFADAPLMGTQFGAYVGSSGGFAQFGGLTLGLPGNMSVLSYYDGISGPETFMQSTPHYNFANAGSGDTLSITSDAFVNVPVNYISRTPLSDSATWR